MSVFFNISSLTLGACAWLIACAAIISKTHLSAHRLSVTSFSLCSLSLILQLFEVKNRAGISDFAAIEDTAHAVALAAVILVAVTAVLNIAALVRKRGNV